jgi:mannose-6-phosphate isomerase-like protein (cupin superfamily)
MEKIKRIDLEKSILNFSLGLEARDIELKPGPPESFEGLNIGIVTMESAPPHGGEVHRDGDEFIFVLSGIVRINGDSNPENDVLLNSGQSCLIKSGEWHKLSIVETAKLLFITPGPNNEHR